MQGADCRCHPAAHAVPHHVRLARDVAGFGGGQNLGGPDLQRIVGACIAVAVTGHVQGDHSVGNSQKWRDMIPPTRVRGAAVYQDNTGRAGLAPATQMYRRTLDLDVAMVGRLLDGGGEPRGCCCSGPTRCHCLLLRHGETSRLTISTAFRQALASAKEGVDHWQMSDETIDDDWLRRERNESPTQRLDRNWASLLQELRVVQTGVQLLTGFLLTVPFQDRFYEQDGLFQNVYLVTVTASVGATVLLLAPVAMHRLLFRRHRLEELVNSAQRFALGGIVLLGVALTGVMTLVFELVVSKSVGWVAGLVALLTFAFFWFAYPWRYRRRDS